MGNPGEHSRTRSNTSLNAEQYQVLLEMEIRVNEKMETLHGNIRKDMMAVVKSAIDPMKEQLTGMENRIDKRFDEGTNRFREHEERLDDHSDQIDANSRIIKEAKELLAQRHKDCPLDNKNGTTALEKKKDKKQGLLEKLGVNIGLPLLIAALSGPVSIWVMVQFKLIALADTTTPVPVMHSPQPPSTGAPP